MALGTPKSITLAVGTTNTTPANRILQADATVNRYVRGVYATNTTGAAIALTAGMGAAAILSSSNSNLASGSSIPANASCYPVAQFAGDGLRGLGVGSLNEIMAIGAGAGLILNVVYSDFSTT